MYLVWDPERKIDDMFCRDEAEARQWIEDIDTKQFVVWRVQLDEHVRDVTDEFREPEIEVREAFDGDYAHADHFRKLLRMGRH